MSENNVHDAVHIMSEVGFIIHDIKLVLVPVQNIIFLGNHIDSVRMIVYLTEERKNTILHECKKLMGKNSAKIREVVRIIGLFVVVFSAVEFGPLHYRELETQKIITLRYSKGDFNAKMIITHSMKAELDWWIKNVLHAVRKINHRPPKMVIITDTSLSGWGAVCDDMRIRSRWSLAEVGYHINYLELLAIFHALRAFCKDSTDTHVQIKSDNTSAIACLNNMGGIKSSLSNDLAKQT